MYNNKKMLFKGNSSRLEFLIEKIHATKESSPSPLPHLKAKDGLLESLSSSSTSSSSCSNEEYHYQRSVGTPSSGTTSTSMSFVFETDVDIDLKINSNIGVNRSNSGPYSCQFCDRTFPNLTYLKKHEQYHGDQMPYKCDWCARLFKHKRSRDRHVNIHTGDRRYRCTNCDAAFSRSDHLKIHMKTHDNQKPYHCTECSRSYNTQAALTSHLQSHRKPSIIPYNQNLKENNINDKCLKQVASQSDEKFKMLATTSTATSTISEPSYLQSSVLTFNCMYCINCSFNNVEQLQFHIDTVHKIKSIPMSSTMFSNLSNDNRDKRKKKLNYSNLKLIKKSDDTIPSNDDKDVNSSIMCPFCGINCSSVTNYAEHYVLEHCENNNRVIYYDKSRFLLDELNKTKEIKDLNKYILLNDKNFKHKESYPSNTLLCGQCDAALDDFESFRLHLAKHLQVNNQMMSVKKINCPKCQLSFLNRQDMLNHFIQHFLNKVIKKYCCQICDKYYSNSKLLQKHQFKIHSLHFYKCTLCKDTFDSQVAIQVHFTVKHTQECNLFQCTSCTLNKKADGKVISADNNPDDDDDDNDDDDNKSQNNDNEHDGSEINWKNIFKNTSDMLKHIKSVHNFDEFSSSTAVENSVIDISCMFKCPICPEAFEVEFLLDKHIVNTHTNNNFNCYSNSQELVSYKKQNLPEDNKNKLYCGFCGVCEFLNEEELNAHKKLIHNKLNDKVQLKNKYSSNICYYCGEKLRNKLELETHIKLNHEKNDNEKHYKCNICDQLFASGFILANHKLEKHCKIQLSDLCIVCREVLNNHLDFFEHVKKHSLENIDPQQRIDGLLLHIPAHCVICRQTLISDLECQLHASYHLRLSEKSTYSIPPMQQQQQQQQYCSICFRNFTSNDNVNNNNNENDNENDNDSTKLITINNENEIKICKNCYTKYSVISSQIFNENNSQSNGNNSINQDNNEDK